MVMTSSTNRELGIVAPNFALPDFAGRIVALGDFADAKALLVMFMCNHCPFVKHVRARSREFARDYQPRGWRSSAINSNDVDDATPTIARADEATRPRSVGYTFPYLFDETQEVAQGLPRRLHARLLPVRQASASSSTAASSIDSRPGNGMPVTGADLRAALDAVLAGKPRRASRSRASAATSSGGASSAAIHSGCSGRSARKVAVTPNTKT